MAPNPVSQTASTAPTHDPRPTAHSRPLPPDSLDTVLTSCWTKLCRGVADRRHPFHLPTLATVGADDLPQARTVVLRWCDEDERTLGFHTDRRSPKVAQLIRRPSCAWLFYDPGDRVQLRVTCSASVHTDDAVADAAWARTHIMSRRCYLAPNPPSQPSDALSSNLPDWASDGALTSENTAPARDYFAVVRTAVIEIDWLLLHHAGHRRARFRFGPGAEIEATWMHP